MWLVTAEAEEEEHDQFAEMRNMGSRHGGNAAVSLRQQVSLCCGRLKCLPATFAKPFSGDTVKHSMI